MLNNLILDKNKKYLLACSFGPDSMALFWMLYNQGYKFVVVHVNYKTRDLSNYEEESLKKLCQSLGIKCYSTVFNIDVSNFESDARKFRYTYFNEIYLKENCNYLLTAHHMDDNIETYLMQKRRNNLTMYHGIYENTKYKDMNVLRPLLNFGKKDLIKYCDDNNYEYSIDITNLDNHYERNDIRNNVVSKMSKNEKIDILNELNDKNSKLNKLYKGFDQYFIKKNIIKLKENYQNIEELQRFLFYFAKENKIDLKGCDFKSLTENIFYKKKFNYVFNIRHDYEFIVDNETIIYTSTNAINIDYEYDLNPNDSPFIFLENFKLNYKVVPLKRFKKIKVGDFNKSVSRFYIDTKMPLSLRYIWPCVINEKNEIVYVPRYRKRYKENLNAPIKFDTEQILKKFY